MVARGGKVKIQLVESLLPAGTPAIPVEGGTKGHLPDAATASGKWLRAIGFNGAAGEVAIEPRDGSIGRVWFGLGTGDNPMIPGGMANALPPGDSRPDG